MPGKTRPIETPVDPTSAQRQARLRAKRGAPVKAYLEPLLRERLERFAAERQLTLADVLRTALVNLLDSQQRVPAREAPLSNGHGEPLDQVAVLLRRALDHVVDL